MSQVINSLFTALNNVGSVFCSYAGRMLVQSGVLIILLLLIDYVLRKRVRAVFRYCLWMLVFVKLVLPPAFSLPTGIGYWCGDYLAADLSVSERASTVVVRDGSARAAALEDAALPSEIPEVRPFRVSAEAAEPMPSAAPVLSVVSHSNDLTWQAIVFLLWLAGVFLMSVLLIQRVRLVSRLTGQSEPAKNRLAEMLNQCRKQVGIRRNIELRLSNNVSSPAVCGLLAPMILMPITLLERVSRDKLRAVLIHELAHIKRGDLWVNSAQTILQIIYFYNPLVWLANAVVRRIREQAVDETVLVALGAEARSYSNTLIDIAEMAFFRASLSLRLIGVVESKKALEERIRHMLNRPIPKSPKLGALGIASIIVIAAVLLPMAKAQKNDLGIIESEHTPGQFAATLPDSVVVELVGVCEHPNAGRQWWRPDGTLLETDEFRDYDYDDAVAVEENECARLLAFKLDDTIVQSAGISWSLEDSRESRFAPDYADKVRKKRRSVQVILAAFPETVESTNLRLGVAAGPWKTVAAGTDGQSTAQARDTIAQRAIIYSEASEKGGRTHISATHLVDANYDCRIYARSKNGEVYEPRKHSNSGSEMRLCKSQFDIPLEKVKLFHLQARPFQWVTFENISLQPRVKTDVQIDVQKSNIRTQEKSSKAKTVLLPDVDSSGLMLDLQSGELLEIPKADTKEEIWLAIEELGKGDLVYDSSSLILVRGATTQSLPDTTIERFKTYEIGQRLPEILNIKTKEGIEYTVEICSVDNDGCQLEYCPLYPNNHISAIPVNAFERKFIEQILELVKQVEEKYPDQATHWPEGPGLYHIDAQGKATVWHYQKLWHRSTDCSDDEVGYGSSQLIKATGMYYLPDGTPLQSRWRERGNGMKDIRVKVGRAVGGSERVALIHRHSLPSDRDLLLRDGLERKILLDSHRLLPLAIIVRADRPMRLSGYGVGDVEADVRNFDDYDQLLVTGPPGNNDVPVLVTLESPEGAAAGQQEDVQADVESLQTQLSGVIAGVSRQRRFVMLVVGQEQMTFEGQLVTWEQLPKLLDKVPNRSQTVLCMAVASDETTLSQVNRAKSRADNLSRQFGFEYFSYVGIHKLGLRGEPARAIFEGPFHFDKEIKLPLTADNDNNLGLVLCHFIKFAKGDGQVEAVLRLVLSSSPRAKWEVRVRLLNAKAEQLSYETKTIENSGDIDDAVGGSYWSEKSLSFLLGKWADVAEAARFEVRIRQLPGTIGRADYSTATVQEGIGFGDIIVGHANCTGEFIKSRLGRPDEEVKDQKTGWWLNYRKTSGLDFWVNLKQDVLLEIRLNKGFKGKLTSGVSMSSTKQDVFDTYGKPLTQKTVGDLTKHFDNQVLYGKKRFFLKPKNSKIFYVQRGLLFWFEGDKILQIVIHTKKQASDMSSAAEAL